MDGVNRSNLATNQTKGGGIYHPPRRRLVERGTPRGVRHVRWRLRRVIQPRAADVVDQTLRGRVIRRFYPMLCCGGRATGKDLLSATADKGRNGTNRVTNPVQGLRVKAPLEQYGGKSRLTHVELAWRK